MMNKFYRLLFVIFLTGFSSNQSFASNVFSNENNTSGAPLLGGFLLLVVGLIFIKDSFKKSQKDGLIAVTLVIGLLGLILIFPIIGAIICLLMALMFFFCAMQGADRS